MLRATTSGDPCALDPVAARHPASAGAPTGPSEGAAAAATDSDRERACVEHTFALIADVAQRPPAAALRSHAGPGFALWRFDSGFSIVPPLPCDLLIYMRRGAPRVTKTALGHSTRKRFPRGSVALIPHAVATSWLVEGPGEAAHIYLAPARVRDCVRRHFGGQHAFALRDFFAVHDPWLFGYFEMVISHYELFDAADARTDQLLCETQDALVRHLVRWHADEPRRDDAGRSRYAGVRPLRPFMLQRIKDYVEQNLARDINLQTLAGLATMSTEHFLRSFQSATGQTPYQYVLDLRLQRAAALLKLGDRTVRAIASECGFSTPNYLSRRFRSRYCMRPSEFRDAHRQVE